MKKKNWLVIIILIAALLIAIVFWVYAKRIELIENKMIHLTLSAHCVSTPTQSPAF
jgi:YbbR domain-containing protein